MSPSFDMGNWSTKWGGGGGAVNIITPHKPQTKMRGSNYLKIISIYETIKNRTIRN